MSYKYFDRPQKSVVINSPERRVYDKFINEINSILVDFVPWALVRVFKDENGAFQYEIYFEWSWYPYENYQLGDLSKDIYGADYYEVETCGEGYYLMTTQVESEWREEYDTGEVYQTHIKIPHKFIKFISLDEIEDTPNVSEI